MWLGNLAEERYGPLRGLQLDASSSSAPSGTSGTGSSSTFTFGPTTGIGTTVTSMLVMTSEGGVETIELGEDSSDAEDHTLGPELATLPEDRMVVMYGKGGFGKNPAAASATGAFGLQPEIQEGRPAGEVHGQEQQALVSEGRQQKHDFALGWGWWLR